MGSSTDWGSSSALRVLWSLAGPLGSLSSAPPRAPRTPASACWKGAVAERSHRAPGSVGGPDAHLDSAEVLEAVALPEAP